MSPYRTPPSQPCLRCTLPMKVDPKTDDPVCTAGCGSWVPADVLDILVPPAIIEHHAFPNALRAETFAAVFCPGCKTRLDDLFGGKPVVSFARCAEHGIWVDGETRSAFLDAFADAITEHGETDEDIEALARKLAGGDITNLGLARRVIQLEQTVAALEKRLEALERG